MALSTELQAMFDLRFFHDNGWMRKQCPSCGDAFWTLEKDRSLCGDSTCEEYQFLGDPLTTKPMALAQMREAFLSYWEGTHPASPPGLAPHTRVPRNPVVARWRDDLYLNIASIANYQPHVTSGAVRPPANPLVVSQPCIRLNDLSNIGRSGRHFACFEMMGHHAFNSAEWGEFYWTEECVAWGHRFLTDALGLDGTRITYKESLWSGGGNAGPCFEVFAGGLEVATLVFMCLEAADDPLDEGAGVGDVASRRGDGPGDGTADGQEHGTADAGTGRGGPDGTAGAGGNGAQPADRAATYTIKGETYRMMDLRIIDTGWGLERLAWASTGTPTAYDTVFPDTIAHVRSLASVPIADDERSRRLVEMHARVQGVLNLDIGTRLDALREEVVKRMAANGVETTAGELAAVMDPIEAMYALCDHLRCLSFMVGDGVVPSNVKAGYLERLVFRRAFRFAERLGITAPMADLLAWNMEQMLDEFPGFEQAIPRARQIAALEHERFVESRERGLRLVERTLQKKKQLSTEDLVELYDTHGLGPNTVAEAAAKMGITVDVPDTFDAIIAERHSREKKAKQKAVVPEGTPPTRRMFYEDEGRWQREFEAKITWVGRGEDGRSLVTLDQTCFFHETGGQPADRGVLRVEVPGHGAEQAGAKQDPANVAINDQATARHGKVELVVSDVTKDGDHPVHHVEDPDGLLAPGTMVYGVVDWALRMDHTRSHTATHIMNQAVRRVLGAHSWQAGTQKYRDCARVDMTHYRRPSRQEIQAIEGMANGIVMQGRPVLIDWFTRDEAERRWGLQLLQGGIPKGRDVRVVRIGPAPEGTPTLRIPSAGDAPASADGHALASADGPAPAPVDGHAPDDGERVVPSDKDFDVEYCGGTHCATTHGVGPIKVFRTERVQDGVERFEYSVGLHGVRRWQDEEGLLREAAEAMQVAPAEVPQAASRFFAEWKQQRKLLEEVQQQLAQLKAAAAAGEAEEVNGVRIVVDGALEANALQKTAAQLLAQPKTVVLLAAPADGRVRLLFGRSPDVDVDMGAVLRDATAMVGGKGGGRPDFAQGAGDDPGKLADALEAARSAVAAKLA